MRSTNIWPPKINHQSRFFQSRIKKSKILGKAMDAEVDTNTSDVPEDEENVFYFESDHVALRGNSDYTNLLRTIALLESQRVRVHQQMEELSLAKKKYLEDPEMFLKKIQKGEEIISPNLMSIATIPEIGTYDNMPPDVYKVNDETHFSVDSVKSEHPVVRGRIMDETKPETYNQLWSIEEQKRLEELLIEYPEERVEMHRFHKIAKALGNRTAQQVSSRVQKYFQKLHSAGMPIPGRIPKNRRAGQAKSKHYYRPSTFFPSHNVTVHMPDDDFIFNDPPMPSTSNMEKSRSNSVDNLNDIKPEPLTVEMKQQIVQILQVVKQEKIATPDGYNPDPLAAKCESCKVAVVSRSGWHCNTCYCALNLCVDCLVHQLAERKFEHFLHDVVEENKL